jgi:hypothetical protein
MLCIPGALSRGLKRRGIESDHSPPSIAEVKNGGAIPLLPHASSHRRAYSIRYRHNFNLIEPKLECFEKNT